MTTILFILILIFILLLILAYALRSKPNTKRSQNLKNAKKENKPQKAAPVAAAHHKSNGEQKPYNEQNGASAVVADGNQSTAGAYAEQRQFLKTGIESIFFAGDTPPADRPIPIQRTQINVEMMYEAFDHVAGLQNFRTEQAQLQKMINDPSVQMPVFSKIILSDPMLTAKILRMANSSYFGMQHKIDSISHALMLLGLQNVKNIICRNGMRRLFQARSPQQASAVNDLWKHSSITSVCASFLHDLFSDLNMGTLFTLGIIHDIGKLIIMELQQAKEQGDEFWSKYPGGISIWEEDRLFGINHEVIGGIALEQWKFSALMMNVVQMHHAPSYLEADKLGLAGDQLKYVVALFLADRLSNLMTSYPNGTIQVNPLLQSYHHLIDKNKLLSKISDVKFLGQIHEAEVIAAAE